LCSAGAGLHNILADISRRIESIEQTITAHQQTAQNDQNDRFSSFEEAIASHVARNNALVMDFGRKLEELRNFINSSEPGATDKKPKTDFDWRVFGGDISPGRK
jgi:hemerythrin-like domain-containing protein